ncbi:hypothetical protein [Glutamicibacter sp.]|uniref:hypothetical protein n=1 Tax=Glutamicibacter sp. TaxID=1931995 RepID=UPI0028BF10E7|nr:hypothetical protein [Glutamicibacter sp.]
MGTNELSYPVPRADVPAASHVEPREDYREHLEAVGFDVKETIDRTQEALSYADSVLPHAGIALSAPLVMGENPALSMKHVIDAVRAELLYPTLLVARKPSQP